MADQPGNLTFSELAWVRRMMTVDQVGGTELHSEQQLGSRAKLFDGVDRQIRARVAATMPGVLSDAREQILAQLGPEKLTAVVEKHRDDVAKRIGKLERQFELEAGNLIDRAVERALTLAGDLIVSRIEKRVRTVVATECAKQLRRVMNPPKAATAPTNRKRKSP